MDKFTKIMMAIWAILAVAAFVCAFFTSPILAKVVGIVFGVDNLMIIGGLVYSKFMEKRALKNEEIE